MDFSCLTPTLIKNPDRSDLYDRYITVPCGRCAVCRKRRAAQWAFRLLKEKDVSDYSHFVTLTYDDDNVPYGADGRMSLCTRDWQCFWKRLRKDYDGKVKYYGVGEYGGRFFRPHWHAIVFGLEDRSPVDMAWTAGSVDIGDVNEHSVGYVTGYVMKPSPVWPLERDGKIERTRPFMSKGLGASYLTDDVKRYHRERLDECYVTMKGGRKVNMPRYYKDKIYEAEELQRLRLSLKRMSKEKARKAVEEFTRKFPQLDVDQWSWEYVRQAIQYDNQNQKSKRNKL